MIERLRADQHLVLDQILAAFRDGARIVLLDAPPGIGKTWIGRAAVEVLGRGLYACTTIALQAQVRRDFPEAARLVGRRNYDAARRGVTCDECSAVAMARGERCEDRSCRYRAARTAASRAPFAVTTTAYLLASGGASRPLAGRDIGVVDECDLLPETVRAYYASTSISDARPPEEILWSQCRMWLAMSASLIGGVSRWVADLGIGREQVAVVVAADPWPAWRGAVHAVPGSSLGWHPDEEVSESQVSCAAESAQEILARHEAHRVLMHAGSYVRAAAVGGRLEALEDRPVLYPRPPDLLRRHGIAGSPREDLAAALDLYLDLRTAVLVAPAMVRGVDLRDEACRAIIVPHLPWASRERLALVGEEAYTAEMLCELVQACGRGTRHADDWCVTYITDPSWPSIEKAFGSWLPAWFRHRIAGGS